MHHANDQHSIRFRDLMSWRKDWMRPRMTQEGIANKLNVPATRVSLVEKGMIVENNVDMWAAAYQISIPEFQRLNRCMTYSEVVARQLAQPDSSMSSFEPRSADKPTGLVTSVGA